MGELWTIREIRLYTGMTQEQFSQYSGVPKISLQQWERGTRKPPEYVLKLLQRVVREDVENGRFSSPWSWDAGEPIRIKNV